MKKRKKNKFSIFLIVIDFIAVICFFFAYGPISYFRDLLVTTAMTTMNHRYFAYVLYSEDQVNEILENNRIIESEDPTDTSKINFKPVTETDTYESVYEEQILKKDPGNSIYKILNIEGSSWKGYVAVIYDPSKIDLVFSKKFGSSGEYLSTMAKRNDALIAINASGVYTTYGNRNTGTSIKDGKVYYKGRSIDKGGGLIGFTKDNVLMLTKKSAEEAIKDGMDRAVEFGPFLVVNGEASTFKGNGGWGVANRTAIGQRQDGIVLFVVIDGRSSKSVGISMAELTELFVRYKAYNAANLDGGGSSALWARKSPTDSSGSLINKPVGYGYSGERYLPNAWMVLPRALDEVKAEEEAKAAEEAAEAAAAAAKVTANATSSTGTTSSSKKK